VKVPTEVKFVPLREALDNPNDLFLLTDFGKFDAPAQLHLAFMVNLFFIISENL
jgi:hypothetical protein